MVEWGRIAGRIRVPAGFALAAVYLWLAQPTWGSIALGTAIALPGLWLRALASGHIQKNSALTATGPYAWTRNPLYLGSLIMAAGFAVAARSIAFAILMVLLFLFIYMPVIRAEERRLRELFPEYENYARHVPRLLPRLPGPPTSARPGTSVEAEPPQFSGQLYRQHREYNAALGTLLMISALVLKLYWIRGRP